MKTLKEMRTLLEFKGENLVVRVLELGEEKEYQIEISDGDTNGTILLSGPFTNRPTFSEIILQIAQLALDYADEHLKDDNKSERIITNTEMFIDELKKIVQEG